MLKVFLCHSSTDKILVRGLRDTLSAAGLSPWLDEEELLPGDRWEIMVRRAMRASDAVIVCLSPSSVSSRGFAQREIREALRIAEEFPDDRTFLIPAKLLPCELPESLAHLHSVDISTVAGMSRLLRALQLLAARKQGLQPVAQAGGLPGLLVSDQTNFASDLLQLAVDAGFALNEWVPAFRHPSSIALQPDFSSARLVCLVRGEGFSELGNDQLFAELTSYVARGGVLLATAWVGWENASSGQLSAVLPIVVPDSGFEEDRVMVLRPTQRPKSRQLFAAPFNARISFEKSVPAAGAEVLLETSNDVPIVATKRHGQGLCIYLNACQHTCTGTMPSPLADATLRDGVARLLRSLHADLNLSASQ